MDDVGVSLTVYLLCLHPIAFLGAELCQQVVDVETAVSAFHHLAEGSVVGAIIETEQAVAHIAGGVVQVVVGTGRLVDDDAGGTALGHRGGLTGLLQHFRPVVGAVVLLHLDGLGQLLPLTEGVGFRVRELQHGTLLDLGLGGTLHLLGLRLHLGLCQGVSCCHKGGNCKQNEFPHS